MKFRIPKRCASLMDEDIVYPLWKHKDWCAHPRKQKADAVFTSDDIAGSNVIGNLADNIINVEKPNLRVTKNRDFGELAYVECSFDPATRRIFQTSFGDRTSYGWDHEGIQVPEFQAATLPEFAIKDAKPAAPI